jgi:hypothetical protein
LCDALIDDQLADFRQAVDVRFPRPKIPAFNCVVKKTENAVTVVLIIFRRIDASLCGDAMRPPRRVLETKTFCVIAEFCEGSRRGSAGEAAPYDNDVEFPLVIGIDEL